jgi:hypothetical protein
MLGIFPLHWAWALSFLLPTTILSYSKRRTVSLNKEKENILRTLKIQIHQTCCLIRISRLLHASQHQPRMTFCKIWSATWSSLGLQPRCTRWHVIPALPHSTCHLCPCIVLAGVALTHVHLNKATKCLVQSRHLLQKGPLNLSLLAGPCIRSMIFG